MRLEVSDAYGKKDATNQRIRVHDDLVVSIGDSYASGEGNPDEPIQRASNGVEVSRPQWVDAPCHRSRLSGPARAAKRLEEGDPHGSITFLTFACTGAEVDSGVLGSYPLQKRPQVADLQRAVCGGRCDEHDRPIAALLLSVGGNDVGFSKVVETCENTQLKDCQLDPKVFGPLARAFDALPDEYEALAERLQHTLPNAHQIYLTGYPAKILQVHGGNACGVFNAAIPGHGLSPTEADWLEAQGAELDTIERAAAAHHGWSFIGGLTRLFEGHGYCSSDPWYVRYSESENRLGSKDGVLHPHARGHRAYAKAIDGAVVLTPVGPPAYQVRVALKGGELTDDARDPVAGTPLTTGPVKVALGVDRHHRVVRVTPGQMRSLAPGSFSFAENVWTGRTPPRYPHEVDVTARASIPGLVPTNPKHLEIPPAPPRHLGVVQVLDPADGFRRGASTDAVGHAPDAELELDYALEVLRPPLPPLHQPRRLKVEIETIEVDDEATDSLTGRPATASPVAVTVSLEQQARHLEVPLGQAFTPPPATADFAIDVPKAPAGGDAPDIDLRVRTELARRNPGPRLSPG